jgi:hypothetical protein
MSGRIYNVSDGHLIEMKETPFATEDDFQELLKQYPDLLTGDLESEKTSRRWLLIRREMGIAGEQGASDRWSLDHLFVDQEGIPTLVEVKRSSDTRIRREVVGQLLDYAANAVVHWSIDRVQAEFIENCSREGVDPEGRLVEFLGNSSSDDFWQNVKTNLQAGRIRLLFVADFIPPELKRIIEFLNAQMDPAEVLGVEIKHYEGQGLKTLVPRIVGQTAEALSKKNPGSQAARRPNLTKDELQAIANERGVGTLYQNLVDTLSDIFPNPTTSQSNIAFSTRIQGYKTVAAVVTFTPDHSSTDKGLRYGLYLNRVSEISGVDEEQVKTMLPHVTNSAGNHYQGFCQDYESFAPLIDLFAGKR